MRKDWIEVSRVVKGRGMGCSMDAPGFPTYTHEVSSFYKYGNGHRSKPENDSGASITYALTEESGFSDEVKRQCQALVDTWRANRPSLDSERVALWKVALFQHFKRCYWHPTEPGEYGRGHKLVIWPVPEYSLPKFRDDARFSDEWRTREKAAIDQKRAEIIEEARAVAVIDNHAAVRAIREFYPEYDPTPDMEAITNPPYAPQQDWYSTCETRPRGNAECLTTCRSRGIRSDHGEVDRSIADYRARVEAANANPTPAAKRETLPLYCRWCGYGSEVE